MNKKTFFFVSQEYTDDAAAERHGRGPTCRPRSSAPATSRRPAITNGTIQPIIDPQTGQPFPGNIIPADRISPLGQTMLNLLPMPNGILNLAPGQQWTSNSAYDNTPEHSRTNNVIRIDQVFTDKTRASFKLLKDRDDMWSYNNFTPGTGHVNEQRAGHHRVLDDHAGAQADISSTR